MEQQGEGLKELCDMERPAGRSLSRAVLKEKVEWRQGLSFITGAETSVWHPEEASAAGPKDSGVPLDIKGLLAWLPEEASVGRLRVLRGLLVLQPDLSVPLEVPLAAIMVALAAFIMAASEAFTEEAFTEEAVFGISYDGFVFLHRLQSLPMATEVNREKLLFHDYGIHDPDVIDPESPLFFYWYFLLKSG
jgi:hypothetical protein